MRRPLLYSLASCFLALAIGCSGTDPLPAADAGTSSHEDFGTPPSDLAEPCSPATCAGCCLGNFCQPGITLAACGKNAAKCESCVGLDACLPEQICGLEAKKSWVITVLSADVNPVAPDGKAWDPFDGLPDPYVQLNGSSKSAVANDTLFARWNFAISTTPERLLAGSDSIAIYDDDIDNDDLIATSRPLQFSESELRKGFAEWQAWSRIVSIRFTIAPK